MLQSRSKKFVLFPSTYSSSKLLMHVFSSASLTGMRAVVPIPSLEQSVLWEKRPNMLSQKMHNKGMCLLRLQISGKLIFLVVLSLPRATAASVPFRWGRQMICRHNTGDAGISQIVRSFASRKKKLILNYYVP